MGGWVYHENSKLSAEEEYFSKTILSLDRWSREGRLDGHQLAFPVIYDLVTSAGPAGIIYTLSNKSSHSYKSTDRK